MLKDMKVVGIQFMLRYKGGGNTILLIYVSYISRLVSHET